ncbi:transposase [Micromonospora sp. CA-259024]|uniref:transposase n=1 Tax=Micromonospora sp. CA-259024 TaxID=3239965 RepID=UPI003D8F82A5
MQQLSPSCSASPSRTRSEPTDAHWSRPRRHADAYPLPLFNLEVETCWQLAEQAGHGRPDAMQRLLYRAVWDADAVRDDLRQLIADRFGGPDAVLVVDETGDFVVPG